MDLVTARLLRSDRRLLRVVRAVGHRPSGAVRRNRPTGWHRCSSPPARPPGGLLPPFYCRCSPFFCRCLRAGGRIANARCGSPRKAGPEIFPHLTPGPAARNSGAGAVASQSTLKLLVTFLILVSTCRRGGGNSFPCTCPRRKARRQLTLLRDFLALAILRCSAWLVDYLSICQDRRRNMIPGKK